MDKMKVKKRLTEKISGSLVQEDAPMAKYTSFRAGGCADLLVQPQNTKELQDVLQILQEEECPHMVLGNGSNVLVKDGGYRGVIVKLGSGFDHVAVEGNTIRCGSGALLSAVAKAAADAGLTGMECLSGIPGSIGGAVFMNAGAYGGEMKDVLVECRHIDSDGNLGSLKGDELGLAYRTSAYEHNGFIITTLVMKLKKGDKSEIKARMQELLQRRKDKQPLEFPSAGSTFKRPEGHFAGGLIEECGLKGCSVGGAQVSEKHAGFIINKGGATAQDVLDLIKYVQDRVFEEKGIHLEPEVRLITVG